MKCQLSKNISCSQKSCGKCNAITIIGEQCKNKTCIRLPFCHIHAKRNLNLEVKKSLIPNAGCGLFTKKHVKQNYVLVEFIGEKINNREKIKRYPNNDGKYILQLKDDLYVDALCVRGIAAMANTKRLKKDCNAIFTTSRDRKKGFLKITKHLKAGSEIYVYYGNEYKL
jgi:hypothetical protein